jgi:UDP-3-O-[3-hydroxymyristoyl] glucosamine N-acyltransferase
MSRQSFAAPKKIEEILKVIDGRFEGNSSHLIESVATLEAAGPKDISFLGNLKYVKAAAASKAGCLLLPESGSSQSLSAILCENRIFVNDPQNAFSKLLELIEGQKPKIVPILDSKASIHYQAKLGAGVAVGPFTVLEKGVLVGEGTVIGAQCYLGENVRIGRNCLIYPQVVIRENCEIGDRTIIHSGTVVGSDGFGFTTEEKTGRHRKIPQLGRVVVQEDVEIGANVTIDRATVGETLIGAGTKIDNLVQLGHNVKIGRGCLIISQAGISGSTSLGDYAILAGQVGVAGHLKIGDGAVIGAKSGVMADVGSKETMFGFPARPRREAFKLQALYGKLPELFEAVKEIKKRLGIEESAASSQ